MKNLLLVLLVTFFSSHTFAQGFAGIGFGNATADVDADPIGGVVPTVDDSDTSLKFFGGTMVNPNFGIEVGYIDLGEYSADWDDGVDYIKLSADASALYFAGLAVAPINEQVGFYAKIGFASWDLDAALRSSLGLSGNESESGMDLMFGFGGQLSVNNLLFRLEFERFTDVGDPDTTGQSDVDVVGLSAGLKF